MTYQNMDHADWVQRQIPRAKKNLRGKSKKDRFGRLIGWEAAPDQLTEFHTKTMDILGMVGGGIYNAPISWDTVDWDCAGGISLIWRGELATWDFAQLTCLVFLSHEARIRCGLAPAGPNLLRLMFHPRNADGKSMSRSHPNLDEAVAAFRKTLPKGHRIIYRELEEVAP